MMHPKVADVAVFGVPDEEMGEAVHAAVRPADWDRRRRTAGGRAAWLPPRAHRGTWEVPQGLRVPLPVSSPPDREGLPEHQLSRAPHWEERLHLHLTGVRLAARAEFAPHHRTRTEASAHAAATQLTQLLECDHPVMLAGMGGVAYADLVAAVSEAGGFGTLGAAPMGLDRMTAEIAEIRRRTQRPLGSTHASCMVRSRRSSPGVPRCSSLVSASRVTCIDLCHHHGVLVASMWAVSATPSPPSRRDATRDRPGHRGRRSHRARGDTATRPQVVDAVGERVPVVAAGGIFDGRGLAATLALGADGAWVGTRFIATPEAHVVSGYREALIAGREDDTVITRAYTGKTLRAVRNEYTKHFEEHPDELRPFPDQIGRSFADGAMHLGAPPDTPDVDLAKECFAAGQGLGAISAVVPAADIVREFVEVAERTLTRAANLVATPD